MADTTETQATPAKPEDRLAQLEALVQKLSEQVSEANKDNTEEDSGLITGPIMTTAAISSGYALNESAKRNWSDEKKLRKKLSIPDDVEVRDYAVRGDYLRASCSDGTIYAEEI